MATRISMAIAHILLLGLSFLATSSIADVIKADEKLAYDQDSGLIWYTGFDLEGSYFNTHEILRQLPNTVQMDNRSFFLEWTVASVYEVNTLDFTDKATFESFYGDVETLADEHIFGGFTRETSSFEVEMGSGTTLNVPQALWVNRGVYYSPDTDTLNWYDDFFAGRDGIGYSDYWVDLLQVNTGPFWLVAELHGVPEPSSLFLLVGGLLGLAGFKRKSGLK